MPEARRPTAEDIEPIIEGITSGKSLRQACADLGVHPGHMQALFRSDDRLWAQYMRARALQGDDQGHRVSEIAEGLLKGRIPADVGRAAMQGYMWSSSRMNRKLWGDKLAHEHTGAEGGPIQHVDLSKMTDDDLAKMEEIMTRAASATDPEPA